MIYLIKISLRELSIPNRNSRGYCARAQFANLFVTRHFFANLRMQIRALGKMAENRIYEPDHSIVCL